MQEFINELEKLMCPSLKNDRFKNDLRSQLMNSEYFQKRCDSVAMRRKLTVLSFATVLSFLFLVFFVNLRVVEDQTFAGNSDNKTTIEKTESNKSAVQFGGSNLVSVYSTGNNKGSENYHANNKKYVASGLYSYKSNKPVDTKKEQANPEGQELIIHRSGKYPQGSQSNEYQNVGLKVRR